MTQHDYVIDNQSFPATRTDLNNVLQAIVSNNSGTSAPSTTFANQLFYNSSTNVLSIRNEDNDAFIPLMQFDQSADVAATLATVIDILDASGTNQAGTALTIRGGAGTGTGAGGSIILQTADGGSSGSSVNSHATAVTILDNGNVGIGVATPAARLSVLSSNGLVSIANGNTSNGSKIQSFTTAGNADGYLAFEGHTKEYVRFDADGLKFNGDTAAANALDDYEEGTFTPVFTRASSGFSTTPTYSAQDGAYVKIGSLVHAEIEIRFNNSFSGGSGDYLVRNLPFSNSGMANLEGISWGLMTVFNHTWSFSNTFGYLSGTDVHFGSGMGLASNTNEQYLTFTIQYRSA